MQRTKQTRFLALLLTVVMVIGLTPINAFATEIEESQETEHATEGATKVATEETTQPENEYDFPDVDSMTDAELLAYYAELSDEDADTFALSLTEEQLQRLADLLYAVELCGESGDTHTVFKNTQSTLAPGVTQNIKYAYAADGKQMVYYIATADVTRDDVVVQTSYYKQHEDGVMGMAKLTEQVAYANAKYTDPEDEQFISEYYNVVAGVNGSFYNMSTGQPIGITFIDGVSFGTTSYDNFFAILTDGKTAVIDYASNLSKYVDENGESTIWQAVAGSQWLVRDGQDVTAGVTGSYNTDRHSRTCVGITAEGKVVVMVLDGRQEPFSCGGSMHELAQIMLEAGCVSAINLDGGGSTTFVSKAEGSDSVAVVNNPSDGSERAISAGLIIATTTTPSNVFDVAVLTPENDYVTPESTVSISTVGVSSAGTSAQIPAEATLRLADASMGEVVNGSFVSNGTVGDAVVQMVYNGEVVGETTIHVVIPEIAFTTPDMVVPYNKTFNLEVVATINNGLNSVTLKEGDVKFELSDANMGTITGNSYTTCEEGTGVTGGTITAKCVWDESKIDTANIKFGKASQIVYDFEDGDATGWVAGSGYSNTIFGRFETAYVSIVDSTTGKIRNGDYALALTADFSTTTASGYKAVKFTLPQAIDLSEATAFGMWMYLPVDANNLEFDIGGYEFYPEDYDNIRGEGWYYVSASTDLVGSSVSYFKIYMTDPDETYANIFDTFTIYIDDLTIDYSNATEDREIPQFSSVTVSTGLDTFVEMNGQTVSTNTFIVKASAQENLSGNYTGLNCPSAKVYVDGVQLATSQYSCDDNGVITVSDITLPSGTHTFRFEISDNSGNVGFVTRQIVVNTANSDVSVARRAKSTVQPLAGTIEYFDVIAQNADKIQSITLQLDLDTLSAWELQGADVAYGFDMSYTVDSRSNTAYVSLTRTELATISGEMVIASLPIRVWQTTSYLNPTYINAGLVNVSGAAEGNSIWSPDIMWQTDRARYIRVELNVESIQVCYTDNTSATFSQKQINVITEYNRYRSAGYYQADGTYVTGDTTFVMQGKTTTHVHTAEDLEDKAATCTENGYTGRTYCEVCNSVVDWGTTIPATGHNYEFEDGVLKCTHDGCDSLYNGVYTDGNTYVDGVAADGWVTIDNNTYYFVNGEKVTGAKYMDDVLYYFDENGVYDKDYVYSGFYTTDDGRLMYFVLNKYVTGYHRLFQKAYFFENNGYAYDGEYTIGGETCLYKEGLFVSCSSASVLDAGLIGATAEYVLYADGTLHISGTGVTYSFSDHGQRPYVTYATQVKKAVIGNGITRLGTYLFCYCSFMTEVEFEADSNLSQIGTGVFCECSSLKELVLPDSVAYISNMAFKSCPNLTKLVLPANITSISNTAFQKSTSVTLYVTADSYGLDYAKSNNIPYVLYEHEVKREIVEVDGVLYYYEDGILTYAGLILLDGDYYYVRSNGQLVVGRDYWVTRNNDLLPEGTYTFGADGKMIVDGNDSGEEETPVTDGIVDVDGVLYCYQNGNPYYAGLFQLDGSYYYARSNGQLVVSRDYWVTKTNDLLPAGTYTFGADGKMVVNGSDSGEESSQAITIVTVDGILYCYKDGKVYYAGLFQLDGNYYYSRSNGQLVVSRDYWVTKTNDLLPEGTYSFGADGKMIVDSGNSGEEDPQAITIVTVDGILYCYKDGKTYYAGLFQLDGYYYYARSNGQLVVSRDYWVTKTNDLLPTATYTFDSEGKMITE